MTEKSEGPEERTVFPILKGVSIGESGEYTGYAVVVCEPEELAREWAPSEIAVLSDNLESHFETNPGDIDLLFSKVSAVLVEFGEPIGDFASIAHVREAICIGKVSDASFVLESQMHIRIVATENLGEVFFID
ncbi:MAG: hypothetical protein RTU30_13945 [Candidatus Thorarchaeota archaeon]